MAYRMSVAIKPKNTALKISMDATLYVYRIKASSKYSQEIRSYYGS